MNYLSQAGLYLIQVLFDFYILAVLLRLLLQLARADFYNPISQFLVALTNPPLLPLRRLIPGFFGIDLAAVVLLLLLQSLEIYLTRTLIGGTIAPMGLVVFTVATLLRLTVWVCIIAMLIRVILSWVNPYDARRQPAGDLLYNLTEPLMRPARQLIPAIGGLDLSPIVVFILLQLTLILIVQPLSDAGLALMR